MISTSQASGQEPAWQWGPGAGQRALRPLRGSPVPHRADWEQDTKVSFLGNGVKMMSDVILFHDLEWCNE